MTCTEILELIRAGYTRAEIDTMQKEDEAKEAAAPGPAIEPELERQMDEEQKQTTEQNKPESVPTPSQEKKAPTEVEKLISALGLQMQQLTRAVQAHNVTTMEGNGTTAETADEIIARIINPNNGGK